MMAKLFQLTYGLRWMWQEVDTGILPALYAATSPDAAGGGYYGPDGFGEMTGGPAPVKVPPRAKNQADAERLWQVSEKLTGVTFGT
jgi:hypothetical protein